MIDKPLQFLIWTLVVVVAIWLIPRRRWRRHALPLPLRMIAWAAILIVLLVSLLGMLDATRFARVNICVDLIDGHEWCNHEPEH
jgi:hypothetical protein